MTESTHQGVDDDRIQPSRRGLPALLGIGVGLLGLVTALAAGVLELSAGTPLACDRFEISGRVLFEDRPIESGVIEFVPQMIDADQAHFTHGKTEINGGAFRLPAGQGLVPGLYLVRLQSDHVVTYSTEVNAEQTLAAPIPGTPCVRAAPILNVKRDSGNRVTIRLN